MRHHIHNLPQDHAEMVNHIRTRYRFRVLKSILIIAVREVRVKMRQDAPLSTISINLIER